MAPAERNRPFFFLPCQPASGSPASSRLNAEARTHVWRQSARKASHRPKALKFISWSTAAEATSTPERFIPTANEGLVDNHADATFDSQGLSSTAHLEFPPVHIAPSPQSAGLIDPFGSLPVPELSRDDEFLLNYAFQRTIPVFGESELENQAFVRSWISRGMGSPMVLNAQIASASTHYLISSATVSSKNRIILSRGLRGKIKAIQGLRTQVDRYRPGSIEAENDLFLTMFILGIHEGLPGSVWRQPHPLSPLATHRDLHVYGRMTFCDQHINALYRLIDQRGGLSCVDQALFGCVLPAWDLVNSCRTGLPPRFPYSRQLESLFHTGVWEPDQEAARMLTTLGACFRPDADGTRPVFLGDEMEEPIQAMVDITVALDHFCRKTPGAPASLNVLLGNCDWVTHRMLSIAPYTEQTAIGVDPGENSDADDAMTTSSLYEICRLCALIYMDMTIFPMPPHTGIKPRLSKRMLGLIEATWEASHSQDDDRVADFLTWATVLGAIAARFTEAEGQYRNQIEKVARDADWQTIYTRLQGYLWFGPVCDGPGADLWLDARRGLTLKT